MKEIYLIRHSGPFVECNNLENEKFDIQSERMILSAEGEEKAKKLSDLEYLKNIDIIYSSNSNRAIATIKYVAQKNKLKINIENNLNERKFGIEYIKDLPTDYIKKQFEDENYKLSNGESLFEVKNRIDNFIRNNILKSGNEKIILSMHAIAIMSYFKKYCNIDFKDDIFKVEYNRKIIFNKKLEAPEIFKLIFDDENNLKSIINSSLSK